MVTVLLQWGTLPTYELIPLLVPRVSASSFGLGLDLVKISSRFGKKFISSQLDLSPALLAHPPSLSHGLALVESSLGSRGREVVGGVDAVDLPVRSPQCHALLGVCVHVGRFGHTTTLGHPAAAYTCPRSTQRAAYALVI